MSNNNKTLPIVLLACVQASSLAGAGMVVLITGLAGSMIAPEAQWSTLALALQFVATMMSTIPASLLMERFGRKFGFIFGQFLGLCGGICSFVAISQMNFSLFLVGGILLGGHNAFWNYLRFAASEVSSPENSAKAISYVMSGGVVAAILAAEIAKLSSEIIPSAIYGGSYLAISGLSILAIIVISMVDFPKLKKIKSNIDVRSLKEILLQPRACIAVLSGALGYASMSLLMTATPLAMHSHGFDFDDSAFVIQWHALAMFVPSFFTGHLIKKFGCEAMIACGSILLFACIGVALMDITLINFWVSLFLLGLGWNFTFIGGTSLLGSVHTPQERGKTQAANDFCIFFMVSLASLGAGSIHAQFGWEVLNFVGLCLVFVLLCAIFSWIYKCRYQKDLIDEGV